MRLISLMFEARVQALSSSRDSLLVGHGLALICNYLAKAKDGMIAKMNKRLIMILVYRLTFQFVDLKTVAVIVLFDSGLK